ncbi:hypothetical protein EC5905_1056 [Escherichia coli 5905]|nr:hypothetical protein EC5905_1056 [Escherichia coli 5905]
MVNEFCGVMLSSLPSCYIQFKNNHFTSSSKQRIPGQDYESPLPARTDAR